jgi:5-methylcytosine-specific restriction endonuclease McrA
VKRSRLRAVSERRRRRDTNYPSSRQAVYDRADGMCEAFASIRCERQGHIVHHIAGRLGPDPHRLDNLLLVCRTCHDVIHAQPERSYQHGWMRRRNGSDDVDRQQQALEAQARGDDPLNVFRGEP